MHAPSLRETPETKNPCTHDGTAPLPSLELSVWNRVEARAARTRDAGIPTPLKTIPRLSGLVGARIDRTRHFAITRPLSVIRPVRLSQVNVFSI